MFIIFFIMFYYVSCLTAVHKIKCLVPIVLTKANTRYKCIRQSNHAVFACFYKSFSCFIIEFYSTCKYNAVPDELPSKFTTSEKPYIQYETDKMMQTSKCISWQTMHYDKSVYSIVQETTQRNGKQHLN